LLGDAGFNYERQQGKPVNLPPVGSLTIDTSHAARRRGPGKDNWPEEMSDEQVERSIREAYKNGKKVKTQGDRVKVRGTDSSGRTVEMWVNLRTKTVETAYPKP